MSEANYSVAAPEDRSSSGAVASVGEEGNNGALKDPCLPGRQVRDTDAVDHDRPLAPREAYGLQIAMVTPTGLEPVFSPWQAEMAENRGLFHFWVRKLSNV